MRIVVPSLLVCLLAVGCFFSIGFFLFLYLLKGFLWIKLVSLRNFICNLIFLDFVNSFMRQIIVNFHYWQIFINYNLLKWIFKNFYPKTMESFVMDSLDLK